MGEIRLHLRYSPGECEALWDDHETLATLVESAVGAVLLEVVGPVEVIEVEVAGTPDKWRATRPASDKYSGSRRLREPRDSLPCWGNTCCVPGGVLVRTRSGVWGCPS